MRRDVYGYVHYTDAQLLEEARKRADRGTRWLDENFPGWIWRIKPKSLNLKSAVDCICGQVFDKEASGHSTGYGYAEDHLFSEANSWISVLVGGKKNLNNSEKYYRATRVSVALGFVEGSTKWKNRGNQIEVTYDELQEMWEDIVKEKRVAERKGLVPSTKGAK